MKYFNLVLGMLCLVAAFLPNIPTGVFVFNLVTGIFNLLVFWYRIQD